MREDGAPVTEEGRFKVSLEERHGGRLHVVEL